MKINKEISVFYKSKTSVSDRQKTFKIQFSLLMYILYHPIPLVPKVKHKKYVFLLIYVHIFEDVLVFYAIYIHNVYLFTLPLL